MAFPLAITPWALGRRAIFFVAGIAVALAGSFIFMKSMTPSKRTAPSLPSAPRSDSLKTALFAGGCFWCVEADFEKLAGITEVVSGYAGGTGDSPTYERYAESGHREVVEVTYDPSVTTYEDLVRHAILFGDPTDGEGSFGDRGSQYAPALYYETEEERRIAERVVRLVNDSGIYEKPLSIAILPRPRFFAAEEYHQDYAQQNPIRYGYYRRNSGRDSFIAKHRALFEERIPPSRSRTHCQDPASYRKPSDKIVRSLLSPMQYRVTQESGTEPPFENEYHANTAEGIYVDVVSGEPLFSSRDQYDSGTGWPSFVKPIDREAVTLREEGSFFSARTEVRSRYADSHLGHVFDDGPRDRGGKRYCMNSAALRFVPKSKLESECYGALLGLFE